MIGGEMRRMIFVAFLFCFFQAYAKSPPIPEALLNAKTAVVANEGADVKDFDKLCKRLKEWGRFELVQDQKSADIVIKIHTRLEDRVVEMPGAGGGVNTVQVLINYLRILNARNGAELWSDKTSGDSKDPKQLVNKLKNRMKKK
jgi:hypothetical protein